MVAKQLDAGLVIQDFRKGAVEIQLILRLLGDHYGSSTGPMPSRRACLHLGYVRNIEASPRCDL